MNAPPLSVSDAKQQAWQYWFVDGLRHCCWESRSCRFRFVCSIRRVRGHFGSWQFGQQHSRFTWR